MNRYEGRVILDLQSTELQADEESLLEHQECAGIIIFARNYESPQQLCALIQSVTKIRSDLLFCVDQEGGRVQRLQQGFLQLPPLRQLGEVYDKEQEAGLHAAHSLGWLMASECISCGLDFSFAPVLDLDYGNSAVIGNRAFHSHPAAVTDLAAAYIKGMSKAGMSAIGKHFPGHGYVSADSHVSLPVDQRSLEDIQENDLVPFLELIKHQDPQVELAGIMPAHVIYERCDSQPAGFSSYWINDVLRSQCNYEGIIFSDDLSMDGAKIAGSPSQRARAALAAGCDLLLVCNDQQAALSVMQSVSEIPPIDNCKKLVKLKSEFTEDIDSLHCSKEWLDRIDYCTDKGLL